MSGAGSAKRGSTWFGHPRGLATLFFTEMWERFSYYGIRAMLVLFMTAASPRGGLGLTRRTKAAPSYGLYTARGLPPGPARRLVADRLLGQRRAVLYGGILIAAGNFTLAARRYRHSYLGLSHPDRARDGAPQAQLSAMVGELYPQGGARRDAGFSIFYSGINAGRSWARSCAAICGERVQLATGLRARRVSGMVLGVAAVPPRRGETWATAGLRPRTRRGPHPAPGIGPIRRGLRSSSWAGGATVAGLTVRR